MTLSKANKRATQIRATDASQKSSGAKHKVNNPARAEQAQTADDEAEATDAIQQIDAEAATASLIELADQLHAAKAFQEVFDLLEVADTSADTAVAWRLARAYHDLADLRPAAEREGLLRAGLDVARAALEQAEPASLDWAFSHKWVAIVLGALGEFVATKEKVANSFAIKESLELASRKLTDDSSVQLALGEWCFKVATISWIEKNAAKMLFGQAPVSSLDEALGFYERSWEIRPSKKAAYKLGLIHSKQGEPERARQWFEAALGIAPAGDVDAELDRLVRGEL